MKTIQYIAILLIASTTLWGQNQLGLHSSGWSGVHGLLYNPTSFSQSPYQWDLQVVSGGTFVHSDYIYIENTHVSELFFSDVVLQQRLDKEGSNNANNVTYYDFYNATKTMSNQVKSFVGLPSFALRLNRKWSIGLASRMRQNVHSGDVDPLLSFYSIAEWENGESKIFNPLRSSGMLWNETALNLAYRFPKKRNGSFIVGVNAKYLSVLQAYYVHSPNETAILKKEGVSWINTERLQYGYADLNDIGVQGNGAAIDIGFTYIKHSNEKPFEWKWSVSLNDVGAVRVRGEEHEINTESFFPVYDSTFNQVTDAPSFSQALSTQVYGNANRSLKSRDFTLSTPMHLNVWFDYAFQSNLYIQAFVSRYIVHHAQQLQKENVIALSGRYSHKSFEIGMPLMLINDRQFRTGLWFRLGILTVGSDHVFSLFANQRKFNGSDLYFAIRINDGMFNRSKRKRPELCEFH